MWSNTEHNGIRQAYGQIAEMDKKYTRRGGASILIPTALAIRIRHEAGYEGKKPIVRMPE